MSRNVVFCHLTTLRRPSAGSGQVLEVRITAKSFAFASQTPSAPFRWDDKLRESQSPYSRKAHWSRSLASLGMTNKGYRTRFTHTKCALRAGCHPLVVILRAQPEGSQLKRYLDPSLRSGWQHGKCVYSQGGKRGAHADRGHVLYN